MSECCEKLLRPVGMDILVCEEKDLDEDGVSKLKILSIWI